MAKTRTKPRKRQRPSRNPKEKGTETTTRNTKTLLGIGAVMVILVVGVVVFWMRGRTPTVASQPVVQVETPAPQSQPTQLPVQQPQGPPTVQAPLVSQPQPQPQPAADLAPDITLTTFQGDLSISQKQGEALVLYFSFVG